MQSLWHNQQFLRLWLTSIVSGLGSKVTTVAIPLIAADTLNASPFQMAALVIAGQLPEVIFGLLAGSWIDRGSHRLYLVGADLGRAVLLATIPLAATLGVLTMPLLLTVTFLCGSLSLFSTIASVAVLPSVVPANQLVEANARLATTNSVVAMAGPGFAGALIQLVSAPKAILFDAISFLGSAFSLRRIGRKERAAVSQSVWRDIGDGLQELVRTPLLRALTISSAVFALGLDMQSTVLLLFLTRRLGFEPGVIGIYLAAGGVGTLAGSLLARRVSERIGIGRTIVSGTFVEAVAAFAIPLSILLAQPVPLLLLGQVVNGVGLSVYSVNHLSLRQQVVESGMLGRITAGRRFLTFAVAPVGAIAGAWLAERVGLTAAMVGAAVMFLLGTLVMWGSPVRNAVLPQPRALQAIPSSG